MFKTINRKKVFRYHVLKMSQCLTKITLFKFPKCEYVYSVTGNNKIPNCNQ